MTSWQKRWKTIFKLCPGRPRGRSLAANLSWIGQVATRWNPQTLHRDKVSVECSGPNICKASRRNHLSRDLDSVCDYHRRGQ